MTSLLPFRSYRIRRDLLRIRQNHNILGENRLSQMLGTPTWTKTLCLWGYLLARRNQVGDYLDVAALADRTRQTRYEQAAGQDLGAESNRAG
jgi:hypothetical protein